MNEQNIDEIIEILPAYAMGLTDVEESRRVEALLAERPDLRAEVESYQTISEAMLFSAPQIEPPTYILENILAQAGSSPKLNGEPKIVRFPLLNRRWLLALVAGLIAILGVFTWIYNDLRREHETLLQQFDTQVAAVDLLAREDVWRFELHSEIEEDDSVHGVVICNPWENVGYLRAENFPQLEPDMAYQVWLISGDERISGGVFRVDENGMSSYVFYTPQQMGDYQYIGITPERAEGSDEPTNPPVARGALYVQPPGESTDEA